MLPACGHRSFIPTKMFTMKTTFLFLLLCLSQLLRAQDPSQYGTPFTGVPDPRDAVIYQVNMRAFSSTHNFQGVINRLDQIRALGTNVIYLMPVFPVGTLNAFNSPYAIKDFQAVGSEFGSLTDLRNLVDGAHNRGMAVILDFVVNQTSWDHPWITAHPDWYLRDANGNITNLNGWTDVAALNFSSTAMRTAMINAMRYWVFAANIDGYRCDYADNPPIDFWQQAITSLRGITTHRLLLLAEGTRSANYTAGFNYNFGMQFYYNSLKPIFTGSAATAIDNSNNVEYVGATGTQQMARYLTNHDVNGAEGTPLELFGGINGSMSAFVVTAYMKGVPFIYNGQEVAFPTRITFPFTSVTIDWSLNPAVTAEYTKVLAFHNSSEAIRRGVLVSYTNNDICAFTKTAGTSTVLVLANLRNTSINYTLPSALANTSWKDAFTGATVSLATTTALSAYQYRVLTAAATPATWFNIQNRWQPTAYLYDNGNGRVSYGATPSGAAYQWQQLDAGNGYSLLKNRATGNYMHVENQDGTVQCSAISTSWYSAMWTIAAAGNGYNYIQNRWQPTEWVHIENLLGYAQYIGPQTGWYSAMWQFVTPAAATTSKLYPNPATNEFYIELPTHETSIVTIYDITGKLLIQRSGKGLTKIDLHLPAGIYLVKTGESTQKIVIQ